MTAAQEIRNFLARKAPRPYCDDCLSSELSIRPRQQVQQKTSRLALERGFQRANRTCARCGGLKLCVLAEDRGAIRSHIVSAATNLVTAVETNVQVPPLSEKGIITPAEKRMCEAIRAKDAVLREFLLANHLANDIVPIDWANYLIGVKNALGNLNNSLGFVATLLAKHYLQKRFPSITLDAAAKAQGAGGPDIQIRTSDGIAIVGEIKSTKPYQKNFGAAQRSTIEKDLHRLAEVKADYRFMFVTDSESFGYLCGQTFHSLIPGVEIVNVLTGESFVCPSH